MNDQLGHTYVQCGPVDTYMSNVISISGLTRITNAIFLITFFAKLFPFFINESKNQL